MLEPAKNSDLLSPPVDEHLLRRIVERIAARLPDACIILFGSRAYGRPHTDSDVDLLVVTPAAGNPLALAAELYLLLRPRTVSLDLVPITPDELARRLEDFEPFLAEATTRGRVLHGRLEQLARLGRAG